MHDDGSPSQACEFAVCGLTFTLPTGSVSRAEDWQVSFTSTKMDVIAIYLWNQSDSYGRHPTILTEADRRAGTFTLHVWLIGEHPLGRLKVTQTIALVD